ncbi:unnamed protein product [Blepharisma stoltei]|uniref:Uncharacterized protein n=1 Tax=Blepharisma stoltei TaxID=1481888 RepID=A0AAU9ILS8_9CILI|nr:unnamed protein product [Blepharisma stoltei]
MENKESTSHYYLVLEADSTKDTPGHVDFSNLVEVFEFDDAKNISPYKENVSRAKMMVDELEAVAKEFERNTQIDGKYKISSNCYTGKVENNQLAWFQIEKSKEERKTKKVVRMLIKEIPVLLRNKLSSKSSARSRFEAPRQSPPSARYSANPQKMQRSSTKMLSNQSKFLVPPITLHNITGSRSKSPLVSKLISQYLAKNPRAMTPAETNFSRAEINSSRTEINSSRAEGNSLRTEGNSSRDHSPLLSSRMPRNIPIPTISKAHSNPRFKFIRDAYKIFPRHINLVTNC